MKYLIASIFSLTVMIENTNTQTNQIQQAQQTQVESYKEYPTSTESNTEKQNVGPSAKSISVIATSSQMIQ